MIATDLPVFDETAQLSNLCLNELMAAVGWDDGPSAYRFLGATLHALRDRLSAHEAVQFGGRPPMLIRGFYYDGWRMRDATSGLLTRPRRERSLTIPQFVLSSDLLWWAIRPRFTQNCPASR
jgi:hypothetical protein